MNAFQKDFFILCVCVCGVDKFQGFGLYDGPMTSTAFGTFSKMFCY
jgi:hypothetical protein